MADGGVLETAQLARGHAAGVAKAKAAGSEVQTATYGAATLATVPACLGATDGCAKAAIPVIAGPMVAKGQEGIDATEPRTGIDVDEAVVEASSGLLGSVLTTPAASVAASLASGSGSSAVRTTSPFLIFPMPFPNQTP